MLTKLQKNTLIKLQIAGYAITLFIGVVITLITIQLYFDAKPLIRQQSDVFASNYAVISKNISVFKTFDKEKIYFTEKEIQDFENQSFVKDISQFSSASFKIGAFTAQSENVPMFYTDLFFESIPDKFLDILPEEWQWNSTMNFIPIIIPENYLNLYNFGFAESQGLPVFSKNMISQIKFNIEVSGNGKSKVYESKIVGFSSKINSILVPENFLSWANNEFGRGKTAKTSRLLIEFDDLSDEKILQYFNENNFSINKNELEFSKLVFFFKSALLVVLLVAIIIVTLSVSFILLSINLIIQKNKELILNLYQIGYSPLKIARFYQIIISVITIFSVILAVVTSNYIRNWYLEKIKTLFDFSAETNKIFLIGFVFLIVLIFVYNYLLIKSIRKVVIPVKDKNIT